MINVQINDNSIQIIPNIPTQNDTKLDESTARRHLKSPGHYLVDPYT